MISTRNALQDMEKENTFLKNTGSAEIENLRRENEKLRKEVDDQIAGFQQRLYKEKSEYENTIKTTLKQ